MNLNQLIYTYYVIKYKTLKEASTRLFVTQPAISQQIKSLEKEIGFPIFKKQGRNVTLTKEGALLFSNIESIVKSYENIQIQIKEINNPDNGQLRLGLGPMLVNQLLPVFFKNFIREYPTITITNHQGGSIELKQLLLNNHLDVVITSIDNESEQQLQENNINYIKLIDFQFVAVVSNDHHMSNRDSISIFDLKHEQLILYRDSLIKEAILAYLGNDFENQIIFTSSNNETNRQLIKIGTTISILPEPYVKLWTEKEYENLHFLKLNDFPLKLSVACLYKNSRHFPPYKKYCIDVIEEMIKELNPLHNRF